MIQWDHATRKVHVEQGFATKEARKADFMWDFCTDFWK